jgi:ribosomal protein S18 acetylase RimI-like enzyme
MVGYEGHKGWINYLAGLPSFQKQSYGKQLINKAVAELQKLGCLKVNIQIRPNNTQVIEFYEHLGFRQGERINMGLRLQEAS